MLKEFNRKCLCRAFSAGLLLACFIIVDRTSAQTVGEVLQPWTPGTMDIHQISTGRGNSALFIFPDGTTMLVDAGALIGKNPRWVPERPDASHTPGQWIVRYVRRMLPHDSSVKLDYFLLTHFHADHMGGLSEESRTSQNGQYRLSGITEVGDSIPIGKLMDRGWPDYQYPAPLQDKVVENYRAFVKWQVEHKGMTIERFQPGRRDQVVLLRDTGRYPDFELRNIMANGEVWTGTGSNTRQQFPALQDVPPEDRPNENMCSAGFRLSYGKFDYFSGGDIPGIPYEGFPQWHDVETPVAQAVGPVEASLMNHHGYIDSLNAYFVGALRPRVWILNVWDSAHPTARAYHRLQSARIYPGPREVFATSMHEANRLVVVGLDKLASSQGHIVIRVAPGGRSFRVVVLDDSAEGHRVTSVHGPYESH